MCRSYTPKKSFKNAAGMLILDASNSITPHSGMAGIGFKMQSMAVTSRLLHYEEIPPPKVVLSRQSNVVMETREKMKLSVSFTPLVAVRYTISRKDYTQEEERATWYTTMESQEILKRCHKEINMLDRGEILRDKKYCARGLEPHSRLGAVVRAQNRRIVREQVLTAQRNYHGSWAAEMIAMASHQATASSQMWAEMVGLRDRAALKNYLENMTSPTSLFLEEQERKFENGLKLDSPGTQKDREWSLKDDAKNIFASRQA